MRAGRLRSRITIESASATLDAYGQEVQTWTPVATVWARVEPLSGRDYFDGQGASAEVTHQITIRHTRDLDHDARHRVVLGTRTLHVQSVLQQDEVPNRAVVLMCREAA